MELLWFRCSLPSQCKTFSDYAFKVFVPYISSQLHTVSCLHLVWDQYVTGSLKNTARLKRGSVTRRKVTSSADLPSNWVDFLRVGENKSATECSVEASLTSGDNVEDAMGHFRFLVFYLLCGIFAGLAHSWMMPDSPNPLIGASGAVAGVIAAYLMLHPRVRVWVLAFQFIPLRLSAAVVLGVWILTQFIMILLPEVGPVAWYAHIGGLIAGAVLIVFMKRPDVPLFDRGLRIA